MTIIQTTSHVIILHDVTITKGGTNHHSPIQKSPLKIPRVALRGVPVLEKSYAFDGFARAGGIDMTEDGIVGTLCAKLWHSGCERDLPLITVGL